MRPFFYTALLSFCVSATVGCASAEPDAESGGSAATASAITADISKDKHSITIGYGGKTSVVKASDIAKAPFGGDVDFTAVAIDQRTKTVALGVIYFMQASVIALVNAADTTKIAKMPFNGPGTEGGFGGTIQKLTYEPSGNLDVSMENGLSFKDTFVYDAAGKPLRCTLEQKANEYIRRPVDCPKGTFTDGDAISIESKLFANDQALTITTVRGTRTLKGSDFKMKLPVAPGSAVVKDFTGNFFRDADQGYNVDSRTQQIALAVQLKSGDDYVNLAYVVDGRDLSKPPTLVPFDGPGAAADRIAFPEGISSLYYVGNGNLRAQDIRANDNIEVDYDPSGKPVKCAKVSYKGVLPFDPGEEATVCPAKH